MIRHSYQILFISCIRSKSFLQIFKALLYNGINNNDIKNALRDKEC